MAKKKKTVKKKSTKKAKTKVDFLGRREGTQGWAIDEVLSKQPKTAQKLADESKLPLRRIMTHMSHYVRLGKLGVKKSKSGKKGYFIK